MLYKRNIDDIYIYPLNPFSTYPLIPSDVSLLLMMMLLTI